MPLARKGVVHRIGRQRIFSWRCRILPGVDSYLNAIRLVRFLHQFGLRYCTPSAACDCNHLRRFIGDWAFHGTSFKSKTFISSVFADSVPQHKRTNFPQRTLSGYKHVPSLASTGRASPTLQKGRHWPCPSLSDQFTKSSTRVFLVRSSVKILPLYVESQNRSADKLRNCLHPGT